MEEERPAFLPPQPAGPEPELGPAAAAAAGTARYAPPQSGLRQPRGQAGLRAAARSQPDNGPAVAGFVLSLVGRRAADHLRRRSRSIVSIACSIFGIVYSRKGTAKVALRRDQPQRRARPGRLHHRDRRAGAVGDRDARSGS